MSTEHKIKLVEVVGLMGGVGTSSNKIISNKIISSLSVAPFLRTVYTLLLDKNCTTKHKIVLINVLKVNTCV